MKTRTRHDRPQPELHRPEWADPIVLMSVLLVVGGGALTGCSKSESQPPSAAVAPARQPGKMTGKPVELMGLVVPEVEMAPAPAPTPAQ